MKFLFMQEHKTKYSVERMSKMLHISRNGYYKFINKKPSKRTVENEIILRKIKKIHEESRHTYGSPRIHAELVDDGEHCSRKRVARLMKQAGIQAKMKKRFKKTTVTNPKAKPAPNLLCQNFTASRPNERWVFGYNLYCYWGRLALCRGYTRFIF